ncbi:DUF3592 domain-containing protein [Streptomyces griseus]|uniref:DUF3592 domain-containing protein n=1 Tax=Streptomyces griseus TaxID=1911 RepID=UPI000A94F918|nr:DUF3592 domain-containing protein [Streptomyces griseus]
MGGIAGAGTPGARQNKGNERKVRPVAATLAFLGIAAVSAAFAVLVTLPAAQHLRSFQDGERAPATLYRGGSCMVGHCQVEFEADGRTVVADLPAGSGGGKSSVGTHLTVRYRADDPQVAVREDDLGGGGAAVLAVVSAGTALFALVMSVVALVYAVRQRRADPAPGSASEDR